MRFAAACLCCAVLVCPSIGGAGEIVRQFTESQDYLANPGMGWQYMNSSDPSLLPETVAYPDRAEISWRQLQSAPGQFDWSPIDERIAQARAAGKQVGLRVYTMRGEIYGGHELPQFVLDAGARLIGDAPDYSDCIYQSYWADFVAAFIARYDADPDIAFVDISGYGNFNEWSWQDVTEWDEGYSGGLPFEPTTLDGNARKRLFDMFAGGASSSHRCRENGVVRTVSYGYAGFGTTQLVMPFAGIRQSLWYAAAKSPEIGFRYDCLGSDRTSVAYFAEQLAGYWDTRWLTAPVGYELCDIDWTDPAFLQRGTDLLNLSHGSFVHDNPNDGPQPAAVMEDFMRRVGYRYFLKTARIVSPVLDDTFAATLDWQNTGIAPSYPRMGQTFALTGYLLAGGSPVLEWGMDARIDRWRPNEDPTLTPPVNQVATTLDLGGLPDGDYLFAVNIMDTRTGRPLALPFEGGPIAIAGTPGSVYPVATVTIGAGAPPADTDGDGVPDAQDAFPDDPAAAQDSDGDGHPDAWNPGCGAEDSTTGLTLDAFPLDPAASLDSDGDGHPDAWNPGYGADDSTTGLTLDAFPDDPARWDPEDPGDPPPTPGIEIRVVVTDDWGTGYCANVRLTNTTAEPIDWVVRLVVSGEVYELWNGLWSQDGSTLSVEGEDWNNIVKPGKRRTFGYCARYAAPAQVLPASLTVTQDWGAGYCADVRVVNDSGQWIDWVASLDVEGQVGELWNALWAQDGDRLRVEGEDWNDLVAPSGQRRLGFCADR